MVGLAAVWYWDSASACFGSNRLSIRWAIASVH
jgi:hypothetical protein